MKATISALGFALLVLPDPAVAQTYSKTETIEYNDDLSSWVLGQVKRTTTNGVETSKTDYGWKALPWKTYSFGKLQRTFSYDNTSTVASGQLGTIKTVSDGRDGALDTTVTLSNWKRGIPQSIKYPVTVESPTGAIQSAVVNNDGTIASVTDENGYTTGYEYDDMGRLAKIVYPQEVTGTKFYNDTIISFVPTTAQFGLGVGHWARVVTQGAYRKITHFDALWRPVMVQEEGGAGTARFTAWAYDVAGHEAFSGYPQATGPVWNGSAWMNGTVAMTGVRTKYDALDRTTQIEQDSELGVLTTTTDYLNSASGPYTLVTNPRTKQTRTWFQMFDQPDYSNPVMISHPEGAYTHITRDVFGKPTRLRRSNSNSPTGGTIGLNRDYTYNTFQELCRTDEPETGSSFMGYDAAGNLAWSASGYTTTAVGCVLATAVGARRVDRAYDGRNRIKTLNFADGQGDTAYNYYADGQLQSLVANNDGKAVTSTYEYNKRRLLTRERLQWVNDSTTINWPIDYSYNANGHLATQSWHGLTVDYAPNALGQPTKAGTFATGVTYHPNGAIAQFTYGNGIVHKMTPNARGLPDRSVDFYGSSVFYLDDYYDYDENGNVAAISDALAGNRGDRDMTYDGLDRLKTALSAMYGTGGANYTYDVLDNLTQVSIGGTALRTHYYCYSAKWQLTFVRNGSVCTGTSASLAVDALEYDEQGNLKNKNSTAFNFDLGNRLRSVGPETDPTSQYAYDGHGRRVWDRTSSGDKYSHYTLDGRLSMTGDSRQGKVAEYIYLGSSLLAIRERDVPTNVYTYKYQHTDALGSPVRVTDAGRRTLERNEYEPYGKVIAPAAPHDGPGYTGHVYDAATGMNYMQQRYYDPVIGRFLSVDPVTAISDPVSYFNRYKYANNNPYKFTDPDGREAALNWIAPDKVELVVTYNLDQSQATSSTSGTAIETQFKSDFSGAVQVNGTNVQVTATAVPNPSAKTTVSVLPTTVGVTQSNREETNMIGGDQVTVGATTGQDVISHELGHVAGAGDQYVGGVDANGAQVTTPGPGNNVMQDLRGPANGQSLGEIIRAPTNTNTCSSGVSAASGGC